MRKHVSALDALWPRTRQAVLEALFLHPDQWWYLSDLAAHLGLAPSSLQREVWRLTSAGLVRRRQDGRRVYYQARRDSPFFSSLAGILQAARGIVPVLRKVLQPFAGGIQFAFVYGSVARGRERPESDVDLIVVGGVGLASLAPALRKAERILGRSVNATVYTPREFAERRRRGQHFLRSLAAERKIFIFGDAGELEALAG
jgi:predicted nucleotidyltransferase